MFGSDDRLELRPPSIGWPASVPDEYASHAAFMTLIRSLVRAHRERYGVE